MLQLPPLILACVTGFLITKTNTQLVGCDATKCPRLNDQYSCSINNATLSSIGTLAFNTTTSTKPLTWTVGFQEVAYSPPDKSHCISKFRRLKARNINEDPGMNRFDECEDRRVAYHQYRNYYLGTPRSQTGFVGLAGCAIFFEGISNDLKFPGTSASSDNGTCNDALTQSCVTDLMEQVKKVTEHLVASGKTQCADLQAAIQETAPGSCSVAKGGKWGTIFARDLNPGPFLNSPSSCKLSMGDDYDITLVQSTLNSSNTQTVSGKPSPFRDAITPILSVINPTQINSTVDISLQCLKPVSAPLIPGASGKKAKNSGTASKLTWISLSGLLVVQIGFWML